LAKKLLAYFAAVTSHIFFFKTFLNAISSQLINRSRVACLLVKNFCDIASKVPAKLSHAAV
jgi:hypothetical protein